ncbi:MAG: hypothetical protein EOO89_00750 [Pedobacter sp.]|nr:MAG: hypothetical protein EOO89_00750 [Pedobacter sp.]
MGWKTKLDHVLGVELQVLTGDRYRCHWTVMKMKRQKLESLESQILEGTVVEVINALPKQWPLALVLTGKVVLSKSVKKENGSEGKAKLIYSAFPGMIADDFYLQAFEVGNTYDVTIARKLTVDAILSRFSGAGMEILSLSFGSIVISKLFPLLDGGDKILCFENNCYKIDKVGNLKSIFPNADRATSEFSLSGVAYSRSQLVSYAAGFQLLLKDRLDPILAEVDSVRDLIRNYLDQLRFNKYAIASMTGLTCLLLMSFLGLTYFDQQNMRLTRQVGKHSEVARDQSMISSRITIAERKLKDLGWNGGYSQAYLMDELALHTTREISFSSVGFNAGSSKRIGAGEVDISGSTSSLQALNNWIYEVGKFSWVQEVRLLRYGSFEFQKDYQFRILVNY